MFRADGWKIVEGIKFLKKGLALADLAPEWIVITQEGRVKLRKLS